MKEQQRPPMVEFVQRGLAAQRAVDALLPAPPDEAFALIERCAAAWRKAYRAKETGAELEQERCATEALELSTRLSKGLRA